MYKTARILLPFVLGFALLAGCSQKDLGRYCFVGASSDSNTNAAETMVLTILNPEAPECAERLCLKQGGYKCPADQTSCETAYTTWIALRPMCTMECETNSDCEVGDDNVNKCKNFVCQSQGAETGFGGHCICVCLDYLRDDDGDVLSKDAFNQSETACRL